MPLPTLPNTPFPKAYVAIYEKARELDLPARFATDLTVHDLRSIALAPDAPFRWVLYPHGTHISFGGLTAVTWNQKAQMGHWGATVGSCFADCCFFFWDGVGLIEYPDGPALDECYAQHIQGLNARGERDA